MILNTLSDAKSLDQQDPLSKYRNEFHFPEAHSPSAKNIVYFAGHSLGLMPKKTPDWLQETCRDWAKYGVEGHFKGNNSWKDYHEYLTPYLARLVGAKPQEVVAMNSLTVNLHLMMVSFYQPKGKKNKILIENNSFPSDQYAVASQARFHGLKPENAVMELKPHAGEMTVSTESILEQIHSHKDELALIVLGNCNYLSGQQFDFKKITQKAHEHDIKIGFNLAHGAGNLALQLHDWGPDFAVWCSYKYLNSGAGGIAGAFVHSRHLNKIDLQRFEGWWGHNKQTRFKMGPQFEAIPSVEAWQLSNPPIFQLASHRASLELFDAAGMDNLRARGDKLTTALEQTLTARLGEKVSIVTPKERGSMLCMRFKNNPRAWAPKLIDHGVYVDFREPDIIRATPAPIYNNFEDVFHFASVLEEVLNV